RSDSHWHCAPHFRSARCPHSSEWSLRERRNARPLLQYSWAMPSVRVGALELAGLAEPVEIGRQYKCERGRRDAQPFKRAALCGCFLADHVVLTEEAHLIGRERRVRQELRHTGNKCRKEGRNRQKRALAQCCAEHLFHQATEGVLFGAAEFIDL